MDREAECTPAAWLAIPTVTGSFLPTKPFAVGETVTVSTGLNVLGVTNGRFTFAIGDVAPLIRYGRLGGIPPAGPHAVLHFRSEPALEPADLTVTNGAAPASEGDIFVAPQNGPVQDGPMILDPQGHLIWFSPYPVAHEVFANDFRVQDLYGQPVLTWWQGFRNAGFGQSRGVGIIVNRHYQTMATVRAANGLDAGSHEFLITPQGDAYITASSPVYLPGQRTETVDSVVQEIDIKTGLVLFDWHALDHVPVSAACFPAADVNSLFDPYHINSVSIAPDGNLVVSMRNTSAVYEVDHRTGRVLWTLGGKDSSFTMGPGTSTYLQHDAIAQADGTLTIFDNGGGLPFVHSQSRGLREQLNLSTMTTTLIAQYDHTPPVRSAVEGGVQTLPDGNVFVGWGSQPAFSEFDASGHQIFDAHFNTPIMNYRAYRFPWDAQPVTVPALNVSGAGNAVRLYMSWNGATDVASWRALAGASPRALKQRLTTAKTRFETSMFLRTTSRYFAVQALAADGHVLATSRTIDIRKPPHPKAGRR